MSLQEVKLSRRVRRVSLQRFLSSKIVFEKEKVKFVDLLVLYENQMWLENKCLSDYDFQKKFGSSLEELSKILKNVNLSRGFNSQTLNLISTRIRDNLQSFLVPRRNYSQFKSRFAGAYRLVEATQPGKEKRKLPEVSRIGKGYRDKGTLKDQAFDGSPSWQEVASSAGQVLLVKRRIESANSFEQLKRAFLDHFGYSEADFERERGSATQKPPKKVEE